MGADPAGRSTRTLPLAVYTDDLARAPWAAAVTLITLPVLFVALLAQRHIISGPTFGTLKQ